MSKPKPKKQYLTERLTEFGGDPNATYTALCDEGVIGQIKPVTYTYNHNGQRIPHPSYKQHKLVQRDLARIAKGMGFAGSGVTGGDAHNDNPTSPDAPGEGEHAPGDQSTSDNAPTPSPQEQAQEAEQAHNEAQAQAEQAAEAKAEAANTAAVADEYANAMLDDLAEARASGDADAEAAAREAYAKAQAEAEEAHEQAQQAEQNLADAQEIAERTRKAHEQAQAEYEQALAEQKPNEVRKFLTEAHRLRMFTRERENFDPLESKRILREGVRAIVHADVPADGLLASMTATWPDETKEQANAPTFDPTTFGTAPKGAHAASPYVLALLKAGLLVWLHGPAGTGKSTCARYAAEALNRPYYEVNLSGSLPSAVKGRDRLKEFVPSEFTTAYREGGIICLEEFDFAPPQTAAAINNALANGHFHNDASGEVIPKHEEFGVVVTANTLGTGATREFQRNRLDGATLDRFRMGRVFVGHDENLAANMVSDILAEAGMTGSFTVGSVEVTV